MKRITIIRETVRSLEKIKKVGLDLTKDYSSNQLVFDPKYRKFGRIFTSTEHYITVRFSSLDVTYFRKRGWKPCKERFLMDNYRAMTNKELAKALSCSKKIIEKKLDKLHLKRNFTWTTEHDKILKENQDKPIKWFVKQFNTSESSIKGRIYRLKEKGIIPLNPKRIFYKWTEEEDVFIISNLDKSNQWLADHFKIRVSNVKSRIRKLREEGKITIVRKRGKKKSVKKND